MKRGAGIFPGAIDTHCHAGGWVPPKDMECTVNPVSQQMESVEAVRNYLTYNCLDAAVLVPHYGINLEELTLRTIHKLLIQIIEQIPRAFGGILVSPDADWASLTSEIKDLAAHPKVVALKVAPNTWEGASLDPESWNPQQRRRIERILQLLKDHHLVLQTHTGGSGASHPRTLSNFLAEFGSSIRLHCVHMGGSSTGHFYFVPQFCKWLEQGLKVFCDCSLARPFAFRWLIEELQCRGLPLSNILFASDEPWGSIAMEFTRIVDMNLDEEQRSKILNGNARSLYRFEGLPSEKDH